MRDSKRQPFIERRNQLSPEQITQLSQQVIRRCQQLPALHEFHHVLLYQACRGEVDLSALIPWLWQQGKLCYLPVITDYQQHRMRFARIDRDTTMQKNRYGIEEPAEPHLWLGDDDASCVLVPVVAFNADCHRLGMGGGYYDRWLVKHRHRAVSVGVAYDFQFCDDIAIAPWDQALNWAVTPSKTYGQ